MFKQGRRLKIFNSQTAKVKCRWHYWYLDKLDGGDGWMEYTCIFDPKQKCPVKTSYKLVPESLVEFCKICKSRSEEKTAFEAFMQSMTQMGKLQREIGQKTAEAELYKKLYEDARFPHEIEMLQKLEKLMDKKKGGKKEGDVSRALLRRTNHKWICSKCGKEIATFPDSMKCPHCKIAFKSVQYKSAVK